MKFFKLSPEEIANISLFTTIILCIITAFYTFVTYKIQRDQKKNFEIVNRPYLSMTKFNISLIQDNTNKLRGIQPILFFKNVGKTILAYKVQEISCTINGIVCDVQDYLNRGSYVFPDSQIEFRHAPITNLAPLNITENNNGVFVYKISYTTTGSKSNFKSYKKFQFVFSNITESPLNYTFLEEFES